uniref:Uncharacterized protein n=1 Tax=Arundo donax TaxID=35708 RepID=A0A0A8Y8G5_ARUDO
MLPWPGTIASPPSQVHHCYSASTSSSTFGLHAT